MLCMVYHKGSLDSFTIVAMSWTGLTDRSLQTIYVISEGKVIHSFFMIQIVILTVIITQCKNGLMFPNLISL